MRAAQEHTEELPGVLAAQVVGLLVKPAAQETLAQSIWVAAAAGQMVHLLLALAVRES